MPLKIYIISNSSQFRKNRCSEIKIFVFPVNSFERCIKGAELGGPDPYFGCIFFNVLPCFWLWRYRSAPYQLQKVTFHLYSFFSNKCAFSLTDSELSENLCETSNIMSLRMKSTQVLLKSLMHPVKLSAEEFTMASPFKKPPVWKRYIDDMFSLWNINIEEIDGFIEQANRETSSNHQIHGWNNKEIIFLDTCVYKGDRFRETSILDVRTHYKPTETFQYTHFSSCHPPGVRKGFIKGEALRLLRTNSSKNSFEENIKAFRSRLHVRGYPDNLVNKVLSEVKFEERKSALLQGIRAHNRILPFVTQYHPAVTNLKKS